LNITPGIKLLQYVDLFQPHIKP